MPINCRKTIVDSYSLRRNKLRLYGRLRSSEVVLANVCLAEEGVKQFIK